MLKLRAPLSALFAVLTLTLAIVASGCGKQEFKRQAFFEAKSQPGFRSLPAKVDIVIVPDNSGSVSAAFTTLQSQFGGFVSSLRGKFWDYHVMKSNMINPAPITTALVNPDFNTTVFPDGTPNPSQDLVPTSASITDPAQFQLLESIDGSTGSRDDTYSNTIWRITGAMNDTQKHFIRPDALLAVIVITNGAEYSVDPTHNGQVSTAWLEYWAGQFRALKSNASMLRFYPIASDSYYPFNGNYCLVPGGTAYIGTSYTQLLNYGLQGIPANFCNYNSLNNALTNIENDLKIVRQAFVYSYIVLESPAVPGSIHITRQDGSELPSSDWVYEGGANGVNDIVTPRSVATVTGIRDQFGQIQPYSADVRTGWVIRITNPASYILGDQAANVVYARP